MADPKDIKKSVEETVNQILSAETTAANGGATQQIADPTAQADAANKAMPASSPANGGEDKIRSGSPMSEEQKAEEAKKAKEAEEEKKRKEDEAKKAMADKDADDKKKKEKEEAACKGKMKKSLDELKEHLDDEELELIKAWREESEKDAVAKSQEAAAPAAQAAAPTMEQIAEVLKKAVADGTADLRKALDEKDTLIKSMQDKIEKMASQPAYDRRSISTLEPLEKSGASASGDLTKAQVLDKMLELQAAGKGVTSHHIAEFEATKNISDPMVRGLVLRELKVNQ